MDFSRLSLARKLAAGFGFLVVLSTIGATLAIWQSFHMMTPIKDLKNTHLPLAYVGGELSLVFSRQQLAAARYVIHKEKAYRDSFDTLNKEADDTFSRSRAIIQADEELVQAGWLTKIDAITALHDTLVPASNAMMDAVQTDDATLLAEKADAQEKIATQIRLSINEFGKLNTDEGNHVAADALTKGNQLQTTIVLVALGILIGGCTLALVITRGITVPLKKAISGLTAGANHIAAAAGEVAGAGQQLAEGATEQAASLEETSASMEEIASMTKQSADNAQEVNTVMAGVNGVARQAETSMQQLTAAMGGIAIASEQTSKIIKTIDEIAFQTNLLALNAAVEAARAGEAGAGFAVVANEVRSLAMRAAEAARETATLIEQTVGKVKEGSSLVEKTNEEFNRVSEGTGKVSVLITEISTATKEQTDGVDQINKALQEMDMVVQNNAATAEESASASEELFAESNTLLGFVRDLQSLIAGAQSADQQLPRKSADRGKQEQANRRPLQKNNPRMAGTAEKNYAKKLLPFDKQDFDKF